MSEEENKEEEEKQDLPSETEPEVVSEEKKPAAPEPSDSDSEEAKPQKKAKETKSEPEEKKPAAPEPSDSDSEETKPQKKAKETKSEPEEKRASKQDKESKSDSDSEEKKSSDDESGTEDKGKKKEETAEDLLGANIEQVKIRKAKGSKNISSGICFIVATFNNTKVSFSDMKGNVISWSSSGKCNFRGSRKSTAYAAQVVTQDAGRAAMSHGMKEVLVKVKGPGMGRDSAIRALQSLGFIVSSIIDVTPVPHNGCRPPKRRRV
jgi:small subunit ribosomal protein S11